MIPWIGDVVKLNPKYKFYIPSLTSSKFGLNGRKVTNVQLLNNYKNQSIACISFKNFDNIDIVVSDGRFWANDPNGFNPLFVLESGEKSCEVKRGYPLKSPSPGDFFELTNKKYLITSCDCSMFSEKERWPYGISCGAHYIDNLSEITTKLCYTLDRSIGFGWLFDCVLHRSLPQVKIYDKENLRIENTKIDSVNCVSCGGKLRDPGMGPTYKYCPKCEP